MEPRHAYSVLFGKPTASQATDFHPGQSLRVVGPVFRDGATAGISAVEAVGAPVASPAGQLRIDVHSSADLVGYEESWFALRAGATGGMRIEPERPAFVREGETELLDAPRRTSLEFLPEARFVRMLYLVRVAESGDHDVLFVTASTHGDLEERARAVLDDPGTCLAPAVDWCVAGPPELSFNLSVTVELHGIQERVDPGTQLGRFLRGRLGARVDAGSGLTVWRPYSHRRTRVELERASTAILSLPLLGAERIAAVPAE